MELTLIQQIAIWALPVLAAITLHEAAHAYAARHFGDPTAYLQGRMTLNPLKHIDPVGTVLVPLLCLLLPGSLLFGWARPVPVNFAALRDPCRNGRWVAAAGPLSNLVMAVGWMLLLRFALMLDGHYFQVPLQLMAQAGVLINVALMVLNLLPIPPLDGGRILLLSLPPRHAMWLARIEPYGIIVLVLLLATGLLGGIMHPLLELVYGMLSWLA
ncbi:site-2 protease family protein [Chitiniphilus purpureus]|uniref:Site-2 protease family protein n=1 Tax=Chitiniphilus purpureus TaxID=2981137 RepID=A0ABY6DJJ9_9NEIS|nr:site-2 protease family protein [Chitiniphilus sp. CD1]UXY14536.1 site-2 protease family protein [Chitiniphilus sp. CD1]